MTMLALKSDFAGQLCQSTCRAEIYKDDPQPGDWMVWSRNDDGGICCAIFAGPGARGLAIEYAEAKYAAIRLHE